MITIYWVHLVHSLMGNTEKMVKSETHAGVLNLNMVVALTLGGLFSTGLLLGGYMGGTWKFWKSPTDKSLLAISMVSPNEGWAVGGNEILRWDGENWASFTNPISQWPGASIMDIHMISSQEGWAVGWWENNHVTTGVVLKWNGVDWSIEYSDFGRTISSIDMLSPVDGWAVGASILRWDGLSWSKFSNPIENKSGIDLREINMISSIDGWIVGRTSEENEIEKIILHWNGDDWSKISNPTENSLNSVHMFSSTEGWAVGGRSFTKWEDNKLLELSESVILHWGGTSWSNVYSPTSSILNSVYSISDAEAWAVGVDGTILRWDGISWSQVPSPTENNLVDITFLSPTEGFAVGSNGTILRYAAGDVNSLWRNVSLTAAAAISVLWAFFLIKRRRGTKIEAGPPVAERPKLEEKLGAEPKKPPQEKEDDW